MASRALVTGAARGIGRATARALREAGHDVVLTDVDAAALEATAAEVGGEARVLDVTDPVAFRDLVGALGAVDVLVNNAGILVAGPFLDEDPALAERQLAINLGGVIHGCRAVLPGMVERGSGVVVNIASVAGKVGTPGAALYAASKHAVVGLTASLRLEVQDAGVHVGCVLPGFVRTELIAGTSPPAWPPPVTPDQVAAAVLESVRRRLPESYVPQAGRLADLVPRLTPHRSHAWLARRFGVLDAFTAPDPEARAAYRARIAKDEDQDQGSDPSS